MIETKKKFILLVVCSFMVTSSATAIIVPDASFEDDTSIAGWWAYVYNMTTPWVATNYGGSPWIGNNYVNGYGYPQVGHDGAAYVDLNYSYIHQLLGATYVDGEIYELTAWATTYSPGQALQGFFTTGSSDGYNGGATMNWTAWKPVPQSGDNTWYELNWAYTATAADDGLPIGIVFIGNYDVWIDDVTLDPSGVPGDSTPPDPDPMTWSSAPAASSSNSITMTATTATDPSGVQYYFQCTAGGGNDSTWQSSPIYEDTGLLADTQYTYRVKTRDLSSARNEAGYSVTASATTNSDIKAGPYVRFYNAGEVTIYWETVNPVSSVVEYGPDNLASTATDPTPKTKHELTIQDISPETQYTYRIKMDQIAGDTYTFYTAFGAPPDAVAAGSSPYPVDSLTPFYEQAAEHIINSSGVTRGICIDYSCGQGRLAYEIAKRSQLRIIGFQSDPAKVQQARVALDNAGVYGTQISIIEASMADLECRDYTANLIVSDEMIADGTCPGTAAEMFRVLRPDGGVAILGQPSSCPSPLSEGTLDAWLGAYGDAVTNAGAVWATINREPLAGAGKWTHYYADPGNTANSGDTRIDNSMKILWYGNPGPRYIIDRHNRPMASLYNKGIVVTPGVHRLMAYDAYNGTRYWDMSIPESARVSTLHDTGWAALSDDSVFVVHKNDCAQLDLRTGEFKASFQAPQLVTGKNRNWGYLAVDGDNIIGSGQKEGASLIGHSRDHVMQSYYSYRPAATSDYLFSIDTRTGDVNWTYKNDSGSAIINPCILVAGDFVYFIESRNSSAYNDADGRVPGADLTSEYLIKLNKTTGQVADSQSINLPFTQVMYLSYAPSVDLVIATGSYTSGTHIYAHYAYDATNLNQVWGGKTYNSGTSADSHGEQDQHPVIVGDMMYSKYYKMNLTNGSTSGLGLAFSGCGTISSCTTHLFARNANPAMYQLPGASASNLTSETRIGCWINMMAAGGMVIVPESGAGCTCDFQIQASMVFQP